MSQRAKPPAAASQGKNATKGAAAQTPTQESSAAVKAPRSASDHDAADSAASGPGNVLRRGAMFCALLGLLLSSALLSMAVARRLNAAPALALEWPAEANGEVNADSAAAGDTEVDLRPIEAHLAPEADRLLASAAASVERRAEQLADPVLERFRTAGEVRFLERAGEEIPRAERWLVAFGEGVTEGEYALQLDGLQIEVGVLMPGGQIEYVSKLSLSTPVRRQGTFAQEQRLYMTWRRPDLIEADRKLLAKAGLDATDKIVLHFYPAEAEQKMAELELAFAQRPAAAIYRTRFGVRPSDATGSEFFVVEQTARQ